jgi:serine/threonine protein kinase
VSLVPGAIIAKSYRLVRPIAEGGMGHVWVADQLALERRVAVKVLTDEIIQTPEGRELFQREARATARVDHPHVVRVLEFDVTDDGVPYLVLELLVGETLEEHILAHGMLTVEATHELLRQTCDALGFAHECGILHRDIKAANLFLQKRSRGPEIDVKLLDFGIALRKNAPRPATIAGTPQYMSPEHLNGEDVDERCDLFSLGVAAYYALTGQFPFPGDGAAEVAFGHAGGTFPRVTRLRPDVPAALDPWFSRALAIDRAERFMTASEMLEAFDEALAAREAAVAVSAPPPRPTRSSRFGWAKAGALAAVVAVLLFARFAHTAKSQAHAEAQPSPIVTQPNTPPPAVTVAEPAPPPVVVAMPATEPEPEPARPPPRPKMKPKSRRRDAPIDPYDLVIAGTEGFGNRQ